MRALRPGEFLAFGEQGVEVDVAEDVAQRGLGDLRGGGRRSPFLVSEAPKKPG